MNINQAIFQANTMKKVETMTAKGYTMRQHEAKDFFTVTSPEGNEYCVRYENETEWKGCTCPAFEKNKVCKHTEWVKLNVEMDRQADEEEEYRLYASGEFAICF